MIMRRNKPRIDTRSRGAYESELFAASTENAYGYKWHSCAQSADGEFVGAKHDERVGPACHQWTGMQIAHRTGSW